MRRLFNSSYLLLGVLIFGAIGFGSVAGADTITAQRKAAGNHLIALKKITIGPDDQYHGVVAPGGAALVFTRKSDLVPHLCRQNLTSGVVEDLLPLNADSQEAAISPEGLLAFTYYKFNARGDICYRPLEGKVDEKMTCLRSDARERSSPFWKSARELGYLVRDMRSAVSQIVVQNIETGAQEVLAEGKIWSPGMKAGGQYLFYNELTREAGGGDTRVLVLQNIRTKSRQILRFDLPGISGFPAVSDDEKFLFFSHYLNDTNNDNVIDGNDNSVVFRIAIEKVLSAKPHDELFPEQLTSVENNCSLPRPFGDQLYVTCAFEGALDVYQLPVTGVVPAQWDEKILANAHQTSRTYQERILILNTLKFRSAKQDPQLLEERLLSDHLLAGDISASDYFLTQVQNAVNPEKKSFYGLLRLYLEALAKKKMQPSDQDISVVFQREILAIDQKMEQSKGPTRFKKILRGLLRSFVNQTQQSLVFLKAIDFQSPGHPLERNYYFELASWALSKVGDQQGLAGVYRQMMVAPELSEETHIYYTFQFLQHLHDSIRDRRQRIDAITGYAATLGTPVRALLNAEIAVLKIMEAPDPKAKNGVYPELDRVLTASRSDYFMRKAMYVRAILNFAEGAEFNFMDFVATDWIRYTKSDDTEFTQAREVYTHATLDRAYDTFAKGQYALAGNYFYGSLSLTDDLESHEGYIRTMILKNQRAVIDERYANLKQRQFVDDNFKFVEALLILMDARPSGRLDVKHLDQAIEKLDAMVQDRDSPIRYLLLGYCYLDKLLRLGSGYDFDHTLFEGAHRNLMLAYDLGRDNDRVKAAALMDLGLLHQRVQNHGLAAKFFAKRKVLGFTSPDERTRFSWFYSRSLFFSNQSEQAALELGELGNSSVVFQERRAFYLQSAGKFDRAIALYGDLLKTNQLTGDLNRAKAYLSYGYSLFKVKKEIEAKQVLTRSLELASKLSVIPKGQDRVVDFDPVRLKLDALGFLGQMGGVSERLDALEKRSLLLSEAQGKGLFDDAPVLMILVRLQMAQLYSGQDRSRGVQKMKEAVDLADELSQDGQGLSRAVFATATGYLEQGLRYPDLYAHLDRDRIRSLVARTLKLYESQKDLQPFLGQQKTKLQSLWDVFSRKL
ncbi:hypothetical protein WDW37_08780 [Bdellovibrionota bacterium FG-1]